MSPVFLYNISTPRIIYVVENPPETHTMKSERARELIGGNLIKK